MQTKYNSLNILTRGVKYKKLHTVVNLLNSSFNRTKYGLCEIIENITSYLPALVGIPIQHVWIQQWRVSLLLPSFRFPSSTFECDVLPARRIFDKTVI